MSDLGGTIASAAGMATILGMVFSPASAVASLGSGFLSDRLGLNRSLLLAAGAMIVSGAFMLAGGFFSVQFLLIAGLAFGGFSYGAQMTIAATAPRYLFGNKYYGQTYSFLNASIGVGALCGIAAGSIIDVMHGSFNGVYAFIAILAVAGLFLTLAVKILREKENAKYNVK
jgi:MFS family permease